MLKFNYKVHFIGDIIVTISGTIPKISGIKSWVK